MHIIICKGGSVRYRPESKKKDSHRDMTKRCKMCKTWTKLFEKHNGDVNKTYEEYVADVMHIKGA